MCPLEGRGRRFEDLLAGREVAGERGHAHTGMGDERRTDRLALTEDHVDHALGEDLSHDVGELERGQRGPLRRLQHHGVARSQRGRQLPGGHHQRVVPGRDRGDHADRVAPDHARVARHIFAGGAAGETAGGAGEKPEAVDDRRQLVFERARRRLAAVLRFQARERGRLGLDPIGELQEQHAALGRRGTRPGGKRSARGGNRGIDLAGRGFLDDRDGLAGRRVQNLLGLTVAGHEFAVDQHLGLQHRSLRFRGHLPPPVTVSVPRVR
jgi:hypothetical protein